MNHKDGVTLTRLLLPKFMIFLRIQFVKKMEKNRLLREMHLEMDIRMKIKIILLKRNNFAIIYKILLYLKINPMEK